MVQKSIQNQKVRSSSLQPNLADINLSDAGQYSASRASNRGRDAQTETDCGLSEGEILCPLIRTDSNIEKQPGNMSAAKSTESSF